MKRKIYIWLMIPIVLFSASSIAEAMTAEKVLENIIASYEKQMKDIKDLTIITNQDITYQKRTVIKGKTVYKTRTETKIGMGMKSISIYDGAYHWWMDPVTRKVEKEKMGFNPREILENLKAAQVKYVGTDKINGHKAHVLNVRDLNMMTGAEGMQKVSGRLWVDASDWVIRKMEMDTEMEDDKGQKRTAKVTVRMEDFRKVNGMLMPYRTVVTVPVPGAPEMSPEKEQEMRRELAEMQRGLEQMPPEMRKMMEAMMKPQIEMMQKAPSGGGMEIVTTVKQVKIDTGLSDDLFDGSKLR